MAASSSSPMSMSAQSPITQPTDHHQISLNTNNNNTTTPSIQDPNKRSRGRPRKYHTDAEREEAKRRYRENHKTKAASAGGATAAGNGANAANLTAATAAASFSGIDVAKQQDVDELWEAIRVLQDEVRELKEQLAERDATAAAATAQAGQKRRKA